MCGKQSTTTQNTTPPQAVVQQYQQVANQANQVAQTPYQPYTGEMVAPVNAQQQTGIAGINQYANSANPVLGTAEGVYAQSGQPLTQDQIMNYYNPYQQQVIGATEQQFANTNAQQQQQVLGNAISQGALGGDRTGVAQAILAGQQQTAEAPVIAGLEQTGYNQALATAGQQYQANPQAAAFGAVNTALAGQSAAEQGAAAQVGAGTLQQQTQQAQDVANQTAYWQQQGYPFQVAQWLAQTTLGFAGTQGQTTTTQQPAPIFSDERLKEDISRVGETKDGQPLYRFRYKGHPQFHIGLIAQDVERSHPEAVADMGSGYKGVDVKGATDSSVRKGYQFGGSPMGLGAPGVPAGPLDPSLAQSSYGLGRALVPPQSMGGAMAGLKPPPLPPKQPSMFDQAKQMADTAETGQKLATGAQKAYGWGQDAYQSMFPGSTASEATNLGTGFGMGADATAAGADAAAAGTAAATDTAAAGADALDLLLLAQGGGRINYPGGLALPNRNRIQLPMRGGMGMPSFVRGYQGGGTPFDAMPAGDEQYASAMRERQLAQQELLSPTPMGTSATDNSFVPVDEEAVNPATGVLGTPQVLPPEITRGASQPGVGGVSPQVMAYGQPPSGGGGLATPSPQYQMPPRLPPSQRPQLYPGEGVDIGGMHVSPEAGMAILSGLAGMLGSGATTLGGALGAGALTGLRSYTGAKQSEADIEMKARGLDQAAQNESDRINYEQQSLAQTGQYQRGELGIRQQQLAQQREFRDVPIGYRKTQQGGLEPVPGGPADPSTVGSLAIAKMAGGLMSDAAVDLAVDRIHAGDPSALQNLGRGAQTGLNLTRIQNRLAERAGAEGWSGSDLAAARANFTSQAAAARTAAVRESNVQTAVNEARNTFDLAEKASQALPRGQFVPWNTAVQAVQGATSSPELRAYVTSLRGAMTAYAQAMARNGTNSVYAQQAAEELLQKADSHEAVMATLNQMRQEMDAAEIAPELTRQAIMGRISGKGTPAPTTMPEAAAARGAQLVTPAAPVATTPPRPANVPAGSQYSPSRKQWRTPDGKIVDAGP